MNRDSNMKLNLVYETGALIFEVDGANILTLAFEEILYNFKEDFCLLYNNIVTNYGDEYLFFENVLSYSKPNFSLLSFLLLDYAFKNKLDIKMELVFVIEFKEDSLICTLRLNLNKENIIKKLFYLNFLI